MSSIKCALVKGAKIAILVFIWGNFTASNLHYGGDYYTAIKSQHSINCYT